MSNLRKIAGHERMKRLISKAGGIPPECRPCPKCGEPTFIEDDQLRDVPLCTKRARYSISCKLMCVVAIAGNIPSVIRDWISQCKEAKAGIWKP